LNSLKYLDIFALVVPLGQAIGRWGNFFNSELYGKVSNVPWAIYIQKTGFHHHPIFAYEFILNLILFFILMRVFKRHYKEGRIFLLYVFGYGIIRFFMEFLRIDTTLHIFGIRFPQIMALIFILFASYFLFIDKKYKKLYNLLLK
jgi:phosphatidylglycerol:prolipoprotein diacylglycerol transferase